MDVRDAGCLRLGQARHVGHLGRCATIWQSRSGELRHWRGDQSWRASFRAFTRMKRLESKEAPSRRTASKIPERTRAVSATSRRQAKPGRARASFEKSTRELRESASGRAENSMRQPGNAAPTRAA